MKHYLSLTLTLVAISTCCADQTAAEKAKVTTNNANRAATKTIHRAQESICGKFTGDNKTECLLKEAKHRTTESGNAVKDKTTEVKNKMD